MQSFFGYIFGGLECAGHCFAYVAHFVFLGDVWIRTQRAAAASRCATNLATYPLHLNIFLRGGGDFVLYSILLHLPPSDSAVPTDAAIEPAGPLQLVHCQSDALTTSLDIILLILWPNAAESLNDFPNRDFQLATGRNLVHKTRQHCLWGRCVGAGCLCNTGGALCNHLSKLAYHPHTIHWSDSLMAVSNTYMRAVHRSPLAAAPCSLYTAHV